MAARWLRWTAWGAGGVLVLLALRIGSAFLVPPAPVPPPLATHGADAFGDPLPEHAVARIGTVRFRCAGKAIWAPDGEHLLVAGWNDEILAMNARTGVVDWTLPGHCGTYTPDIDLADFDDLSRIVRRGQIPQHSDHLGALALFPDQRRLLSAGNTHRVWDLETRAELRRIPLRGGDSFPVAISPDGKLAAFDWLDCVRIVDLERGRERGRTRLDANAGCVAWSREGDLVYAGLTDGRLAIVRLGGGPVTTTAMSDCEIRALLLVEEGRDLWALDVKGCVTVRSLADASAPVRRVEPPEQSDRNIFWGTLVASPDGRIVAVSGSDPIRWLDAATAEPVTGPVAETDIVAIGWSPDGRRFAAYSRGALRVFGNGVAPELDAETGCVRSIAWSPDGTSIVTATGLFDRASVRVCDAASGRLRWKLAPPWGVTSVAWSADGASVVVSSHDTIVSLAAATGEERKSFAIAGKSRHSPRLGPHGESAAWFDSDQTLHIVDLRGEAQELEPTRVEYAANDADPLTALVRGHPDRAVLLEIERIAVGPSGAYRVVPRLRTRTAGSTSPSIDLEVPGADVFALSRDGRLAVAGSGTAVVLDLAITPPRELLRLTTEPSERRLGPWGYRAAALSLDGSRVAIADSFDTIHVHALPGGAEVRTLRGHRAPVTCLAFSDDGKRLASGSEDTTALVWDLGD